MRFTEQNTRGMELCTGFIIVKFYDMYMYEVSNRCVFKLLLMYMSYVSVQADYSIIQGPHTKMIPYDLVIVINFYPSPSQKQKTNKTNTHKINQTELYTLYMWYLFIHSFSLNKSGTCSWVLRETHIPSCITLLICWVIYYCHPHSLLGIFPQTELIAPWSSVKYCDMLLGEIRRHGLHSWHSSLC